jgi:5-methyltetrahydrofolate--homocysteine methyltransferase
VDLLEQRIAIIDGAMGTVIQRYKLGEAQFRGERFRDWNGKDLKGNNELLQITQPQVIEEIHRHYLEAGADLIETNTFSATTIGQHDFFFRHAEGRKDQAFFNEVIQDPFLRELAREMNLSSARLARQAANTVGAATGIPRYVAGAIGPMPVTTSITRTGAFHSPLCFRESVGRGNPVGPAPSPRRTGMVDAPRCTMRRTTAIARSSEN